MKNIPKLLFLIGMICIVYIIIHFIKGGGYDNLLWIALTTFFVCFIGYFFKDMIGKRN